jgi:osmotically-inducible protein OsmY
MQQITKLFFAISLTIATSTLLTGCFTAVATGAAAGGAMAADRRTSGNYVEDENIEIKTERKLGSSLGEEAHVNVTSYNRNVLLTGEVPDEATKAKAETLAKTVESVRNITNEIAIGPKSSIGSRSNDTYLTSKVKTKFLTENRFQANYVKVVTENGVVYLMGLVTKAEADAATEIASNTEGVEKVVRVFEYMNEGAK